MFVRHFSKNWGFCVLKKETIECFMKNQHKKPRRLASSHPTAPQFRPTPAPSCKKLLPTPSFFPRTPFAWRPKRSLPGPRLRPTAWQPPPVRRKKETTYVTGVGLCRQKRTYEYLVYFRRFYRYRTIHTILRLRCFQCTIRETTMTMTTTTWRSQYQYLMYHILRIRCSALCGLKEQNSTITHTRLTVKGGISCPNPHTLTRRREFPGYPISSCWNGPTSSYIYI